MYPDACGVAVSGTNVHDVPACAEQLGDVAAPAADGRASTAAAARAPAASTWITLMGVGLTPCLLARSGRSAARPWTCAPLLPDLARTYADRCDAALSGRTSRDLPRSPAASRYLLVFLCPPLPWCGAV